MVKEKPQTINLNYEFIWKNPRYDYINLWKKKAQTWTKTNKNWRRVLKVNLVESTRKEWELTYDLWKYRKSNSWWTVHCYPMKKEKAEDFWKRFEPVATAEYIRYRMNWINTAVNLVGSSYKQQWPNWQQK